MFQRKYLLIYLILINTLLITCAPDLIKLDFDLVKRGSLKNNEYDYYKLALPKELDNDSHLIIESEPNTQLDKINNIISDPNLYISTSYENPSMDKYNWKSERFGDEIISINPKYLSPEKVFYISVHCKTICNYILKAQLVKDIPLKINEMNVFSIKPKTVTKFSFNIRQENFEELYINVIGSYINSFKAYLAKENPSSSNTLKAEPIIFNGYRFKILKSEIDFNNKDNNNNIEYNLIIDNENDNEEIKIWFQYDNENILIKEADILYDSIDQNKAHCYYFPLDSNDKYKDIILSTSLFNGEGFIYFSGFEKINANLINKSYRLKEDSYLIYFNKAIHLSENDIKNLEKKNFIINPNKNNNQLHFCFYAENPSSFSMKMYFLENYNKFQALNVIYPGIGVSDVIPKNSIKKYKLEYFNIQKDISFYLLHKTGKMKLYLYIAKPNEDESSLEKKNFQFLMNNGLLIEGKSFSDYSFMDITKEKNKCIRNEITGKFECILNSVVECLDSENCEFNLFYDHSKSVINMKPKHIYTNVISESEEDSYKITIKDPSIKNFAVVLNQNTGQTLLRCDYYITERNTFDLNEQKQNSNFLPNLIKISTKLFNTENLLGTFTLRVKGLSYGSYSLYYYTYNEEENMDQLDQDKISMKLDKGKIIRDIFIDNHKFKVYLYDSSTIGNKTDLYIGLVETDITNLELYVFKDINDFAINNNIISGYLWKADFRDFIYIHKDDPKYLDNDILYIMIYKSSNHYSYTQSKDSYTTFYLGITDETTPLLLIEGIEFKHRLNFEHKSQIFNYYFMSEKKDLKDSKQNVDISLSIYYGHVIIKIYIENKYYIMQYLSEEANLITIKNTDLNKNCLDKSSCSINIEVINDENYLSFSSFLISVKSELNTPIILKPGVVNKRTILSGEEHHFIVDLKPEKFGAKITSYFVNGYGEIYARRLLRSEMFDKSENYHFPNKDFYEYSTNYKNQDFSVIEIPLSDFNNHSYCRILLTVKGTSPNYYSTKIEYTLSISNSLTEIFIEKNYKLFISQGEINYFHFKVEGNKRRLYISMTDKDQDANMYLSYDKYNNNINEYQWKNIGAFNEYIDLSIDDTFFVSRGMRELDGDYYLAIQGKDDTFYNLYISAQDVKIITLDENHPAGCTCEYDNDNCYFRYENLKNPNVKNIYKKKIIFYPEFTYGYGNLYGKLYKNGNMDEIMKNLPNEKNNDAKNDLNQLLIINLEEDNPKFTYNSVIVVSVQCKQKSLFDMSAALLDKNNDVTRNSRDYIYLKPNRDNIFYLSDIIGITSKFSYYIYNNIDINFQIKALYGKIKVHSYTNSTSITSETKEYKNIFHHISDFNLDSSEKEARSEYFGKVPKEYGYGHYIYFDIKPESTDNLINININYNDYMTKLPLNKDIYTTMKNYNCYAYFEFSTDINEVILTITSLEKDMTYNVYVKINIIDTLTQDQITEQSKLRKPSKFNFDLQGKTNSVTSSLALRIKNIPMNLRNFTHSTIVLINIESTHFSNDKKLKINVSPVMNNILRLKPQQRKYYFSEIEQTNTERAIFNLKNNNPEDDLMIIEISSCKGNFFYALVDYPPSDNEDYFSMKKGGVQSEIYSSNGKKIITVKNLQAKEYFLVLFGGSEDNNFEIGIDNTNKETNNVNNGNENNIDVLFFYYTTSEKNFNYLVTKDNLEYESKDDFNSINFILPETKKRDIFGRENYANSMDYSFIFTDEKKDFEYMESTCYLIKLMQKNITSKYKSVEIEFDERKKIFKISGLQGGKEYYMNILASNSNTGEVITYKPVKIFASMTTRRLKVALFVFLIIMLILFLFAAFYVYRKYRIKQIELNYVEDLNKESPRNKNRKIAKLKNINLDFVKKKYNQLSEDNQELNPS